MNCGVVRDRLVEHALGTLPDGEGTTLDRHLAWCAACRKEAGDLERAASTFAFALAPAVPGPPPELEERVVADVQRAAGGHRSLPRRGRLAIAAVAAAMVAVSALGWGAVMAGRAARFEDRARAVEQRGALALQEFKAILGGAQFSDPGNRVYFGTLTAPHGGTAAGAALTLASPSTRDLAVVMVNGFRPSSKQLPLRVVLMSEHGRTLRVGVIRALDTSGGAIVSQKFDVDISRYTAIEVFDSTGAIVMRGSVAERASTESPTPAT